MATLLKILRLTLSFFLPASKSSTVPMVSKPTTPPLPSPVTQAVSSPDAVPSPSAVITTPELVVPPIQTRPLPETPSTPSVKPAESSTFIKFAANPLDELICTQKFGERPEFYAKYGSPKGHNGLDFRTKTEGSPQDWKRNIYAVWDGVVSEAREDTIKGKFVRLVHRDFGFETVYLHLSSLDVASGEAVTAGQKIGLSGNTGAASEAPHLHFGCRPISFDSSNGYMGYQDPEHFLIGEIKFV